MLHRQAAVLLREDARRHDDAAAEIDGGLSFDGLRELTLPLRLLTITIEKAALEYRLARLGVR